MRTHTTNQDYFVLPPGATQEEQWSRAEIEEMCRSGRFSPDTRIFDPEKNEWVRAADAGLGLVFDGDPGGPDTVGGGNDNDGLRSVAAEYEEVRARLVEDPYNTADLVEAGRLAAELGDRDSARAHFQKALRVEPFSRRVAREVQRRFSKAECGEFQYLRRDPPVWDDLVPLLAYPISRGPAYFATAAAVLFVFLTLPHAGIPLGALVFVWCLQMSRSVAGGSERTPLWHAIVENPVREVLLPLAAGAAVAVECTVVVYGLGRLVSIGTSATPLGAIKASPVLSVSLSMVALAYLPAVFVRLTLSAGIIVDLLNPWTVIRAMRRMGQEYAVSAVLVVLAVSVVGALSFLSGGVPVLGELVVSVTASYILPVVAFVLGRLAGRMKHLL